MRLAGALLIVVASATPARANSADAGSSGAFAELERDVQRRTEELATRDFGFYGQDERRRLELELAHLQRIHQRLKGYALAVPPSCPAFWRPGSQRTAQPTQVMTPDGPANLAAARANGPPRASAGITPQDFFCKPRGTVPDEIVAKVRAVEDAKRALQSNDFAYSQVAARRALEQKIGDLEVELAQLGVPGDLYQPVTKFDVVTPSVNGVAVQNAPADEPATSAPEPIHDEPTTEGFGGLPRR
jgi:hypothetical protein